MKFNPNAIVLWLLLAGIGYLVGGPHAALVWLLVGFGVSLASGLIVHLTK